MSRVAQPAFVGGFLAVVALALGGCVTLDRTAPRTSSSAISVEEAQATTLGKVWKAGAPVDQSHSAFRLLPNSLEALAARLVLIDRAERTLDLQYYVFHGDDVGLFLVDRLVVAADRGVRVRILIDDMYAHGIEENLAAFDGHPNIELRLFNPWTQRGGKFVRGMEFVLTPRLNHRMHNKMFVADGTAAVLGGRNLADEYFDLNKEFDFRDLDVVAVGPVAADAEKIFDAFWNGADAISLDGLSSKPDSAKGLADGRARLVEHRERMRDSPYATAVRGTDFVQELQTKSVNWVFARGHVLGDLPEKTTQTDAAEWKGSLAESVRDVFFGAQRELLATSPYFVPRTKGTERLCELVKRGVDVRILTNSCASNDVPVVHAGYSKYRTTLVREGVRLHELRRVGSAVRENDETRLYGSGRSSLHAKTFVVDRERVFVGSMNLDPRSIAWNTEVGVLIESPELAARVAKSIESLMAPEWSYRLVIGPLDELNWISVDADGKEVRLRQEPDASFGDEVRIGVFGLLPIEGQI